MKNILFLLALLSFSISIQGQEAKDDQGYQSLVLRGLEMLETSNYDSCMTYFHEGFKIKQTSYLSTLRYAACAYSKGDRNKYEEQLDKAVELSWAGTKEIFETREEFNYLQGTEFQDDLLIKYNEAAKASGLNLALLEEFQAMRITDQKYRNLMNDTIKKYGWDSPQMKALWDLQNPIDEANTARISEIMDEMGYPGKSVVGNSQASTAFMIIQHSDRVNLGIGKPQIYGSQLRSDDENGGYYFLEIEEPFKVDSLRASVGLGPLQEYADRYEVVWDPEKHIQRFPVEKTTKDSSK